MNYSYCRLHKQKDLESSTQHFEKREELAVEEYHKATILPVRRFPGDKQLFGRGGVVDEEKRYIQLSSIDARLEGAYPAEDVRFVDERVVYCGYLVNHWGHFLIEGVARLWYYLTNPDSVDRYVFISESGG